MAHNLERKIGSESDKVNCPFFFKIGACKYMDKCQRRHNYPVTSQTILIPHIYSNSPIDEALANHNNVTESDLERATNTFEQFYEDVFKEVSKYGMVDDMVVCDNLSPQLIGNVYVKFVTQTDAQNCFSHIKGLYYGDVLIQPQYSPVVDFTNAKCKQELEGNCKRGGNCNYMHIRHVSASFKQLLFQEMLEEHPQYRNRRRGQHRRNRSVSRERKRSSSGSRDSARRRAMIAQWNERQ